MRSGFTLETTTREWYLAGTIQVLNFLARHHKLLMTDNDAFFTHNLSHSLRNVDLAKAKCDASEENDGFRFAIGIDPEGKSPKVIQEALSSGRMFFYTDRGPRLITPELMESIRNAQRRITGESKRDVDLDLNLKIGYADLASADAIAEELGARLPSAYEKATANQLRQVLAERRSSDAPGRPGGVLTAERAATDPKVFTKIHLHFVVKGRGLKEAQVKRAVELSAEKYCSASIMLGAAGVAITHDYEIVELG